MPDVKTTLTWILKDEVSGTARKIDGNLSKLGVKTKASGALMLGAATAITGVFLEAGKAAASEEVNIRKMNTAIAANVAGWNGDTKAIEDHIESLRRTAFSDDDIRASMALLVAATHDVNEAFTVQQTAMDLARFKGISLQEASEALTRVEGGQYRMLKSLGIVLEEGATATDALAAVQKVAAGQADAYANTEAASMERLGNRFKDLEETAGQATLAVFDFFDPPQGYSGATLTKELLAINSVVKTLTLGFIDLGNSVPRNVFKGGGVAAASGSEAGHPGGGRASGGPVMAGQTYTVGEHGPETLVMGGGSGTVVPNGGGFTIQGVSAATIADMVDRELYFKLSRSSPSAVRK